MDFKHKIHDQITESIDTKKIVLDRCQGDILECGLAFAGALKSGGKALFCGNGGSAADSQHLAAELVVRLRSHINRAALPGIALTVDPSILTAGGNDIGFDNIFARGVEAYGREGDVLIGISTSGSSMNVLRAMRKAREMNIITIGLLGKDGGTIESECDHKVIIPSEITARIQESHIMIGHIWCEMAEEIIFPELFE